MKSLYAAGCLLVLAGCAEQTEWIYVPADGYRCEVKIDLPERVRVGEVLVLAAERRSGPWKRVRREEAPNAIPWSAEPPAFEEGFAVTANVRWEVTPSHAARFGQDGMRARTVTFTAPGRYKIRAVTATPTPATSNEVEIVVE